MPRRGAGASETRRGGNLRIWLPPLAGRRIYRCSRPAGGGPDGDFAAVQVIDLETGMQCAELQQRLGALELAHVLPPRWDATTPRRAWGPSLRWSGTTTVPAYSHTWTLWSTITGL